MLHAIWVGLIVVSLLVAGWKGQVADLTTAAFDACRIAVMDIALPLIGVSALWLGMMRLAERAGGVQIVARLLRPLMTRLFPSVPADHPAMGSMLMNMSANMLGLGNAATPLGLRAMKDLQTLNMAQPHTATNAMVMFLAINTSSIQLLPTNTMNYLYVAGSTAPERIIASSLIATVITTLVAVVAARMLQELPWFRLAPGTAASPETIASHEPEPVETSVVQDLTKLPPLTGRRRALLWSVFILFCAGAGLLVGMEARPDWFGRPIDPEKATGVSAWVNGFSSVAVPLVLAFIPLMAYVRGLKVYSEFVDGAKEGFDLVIRIIPYLVGMLVAIGLFRASGAIDYITQFTAGFLAWFGVPSELLPMALMRPLSGGGTVAIFNELIRLEGPGYGPDSLLSSMAGTLFGSTETTFYVLAVYFGAVGIQRTRHAVPAGLAADMAGLFAAVWVCRLLFSA